MKTQNLPPATQRPQDKYVSSQEKSTAEVGKDGKQSARLAVGDVISVKVEQQLTAGRAMVSFQGNRFTALTDVALRQGEVFKALVESLGSEIKLKPLISQAKILEQKLSAEVKSLIGDKEKASDTAKWAKNLANEAKGGTAAKSANQAAVLTRTEVTAKAEATLNMLKNVVTTAKEGQAISALANSVQNPANPFAKMASNAFTQSKYLQMAAETGVKAEKLLNLGTLLANDKAGPVIRENISLLNKIMDRILLSAENKTSKEALMTQMRDSGLQLEKKIADLVRDGAHHEFPKMAAKDLKGQLLKLKGELQQMAQDKTLNLPANVREEIIALQKEVSAKINNIELNQVLNTVSREKDNSMLFQIPFMQNEEIKNSVLEYKRRKSQNEDEPDELAISFFLEMSNVGELRIDGLLRHENFNGVINVTTDEAAQTFRQNLSALALSMEAHGISANIGIKKVAPQDVSAPENTDFLKSDEFRDSILDLKV